MPEPSSLNSAMPIGRRPELPAIESARHTTAIFSVAMAIAIAMSYALVQPDFWRGLGQVCNSLAVSIFLLLLPQGYWELRQWLKRSEILAQQASHQTVMGVDALVTLLGIAALVGLGWLASHSGINAMPILWVLAIVLLGIGLRQFTPPKKLGWRHLVVGAIAVLFYAYLTWSAWGLSSANAVYMTPLSRENLLAAKVHMDTLFHSSIAAMIQTYGVSSNGLDGPVYIPYHTGSHWLFAHLAPLLGLSVFQFYNLAYPIVILPLFFRSFLNFSIDLRCLGNWVPSRSLGQDWKFWGLLYLGFVGILPSILYKKILITLTSSLLSQSHLIALTLTFLILSLCLYILKYQNQKNQFVSQSLLLLAVSFLLGLVTFSKVSVGFILFCILCYGVIRLHLYRKGQFLLALTCATVIQIAAFKWMGYFGGPLTSTNSLQLFEYFKYLEPGVRFLWLPVLLIWSILYLSLRFQALGLNTVADLVNAGSKGLLIDAEIIVLASFLGLAPGLILSSNTLGGSAYYFMDFQMWLSLSFLLGAAHRSMAWQYVLSKK